MFNSKSLGLSFKPGQFVRISTQLVLVFAVLVSLVASVVNVSPARAATTLTVTPITWNVIGLDSNNVNVGPNRFPVGARVCNTGAAVATNVTATFVWPDGTPAPNYINIRPGTNSVLSVPTLAGGGACTDFYFEVEIDRNASAYNFTRKYRIDVTETGTPATTWSTPDNRELFVEHLISQSRNSTESIWVSTDGAAYIEVGPYETATFMVGQEYWIKLEGFTATNGYEQIETFINLPNTIFQVLSVSTDYTADTSATVSDPNDKLYGDSCVWENNSTSLNYRSCLSTGKNGGDITVTYKVRIVSVPASPLTNPEMMLSLIYDFSGSSYHYNADFSVPRYARIVNASIEKSFSPKAINSIPAGTSTLTFTITNPGPAAISLVNFTDNLPAGSLGGQMAIASTGITYTNCGSPSPASGSLTVGQTSLSFSNITVAGLGACTIAVTVTALVDGTYNNDSNNLFIDTVDTGDDAKDTLIVTSKPAGPSTCATPVTLATWTMPTTGQGSGGPPPPYTTRATDVTTTNQAAGLTGAGSQSIVAGDTGQTNAWMITDAWPVAAPTGSGAPYFEFSLDTSNYGGAFITFDYYMDPPGDWASGGSANNYYVYTSTDATNYTLAGTYVATKAKWLRTTPITASTTGLGTTYFRITANSRRTGATVSNLTLDNITIDGCPRPNLPTLSKAFSPTSIATSVQYSTLTFTFTNPNASSLTGVGFSDTLPTGLVVNDPNGTPAATCTTGSISGQTISAIAGGTSISMSGATLAANSSCSFSVRVKGNIAGDYHNVSGNITSTETGQNTTSTGYGTSDLKVVDPPIIAKAFGATYILTGNTTSLSFIITNPNSNATLSSVAFSDTLPGGVIIATPNGLTGSCGGGTITATAGSSSVSLSGATLAAGASCTFTVNVQATTSGVKVNTTGNVSHVINGSTVNGNTATATLLVKDAPPPKVILLKQVSSSATGPWYNSTTITAGTNVYYRFMVENTGDVAFTNIRVNDSLQGSPITCSSWKRAGDDVALSGPPFALPVASASADPAAYCVYGPVIASAGDITNTATAQGYESSTWTDSNNDTANYKNYNYGHLPSAYLNMNLVAEGGAMHLNGNTYFGSSELTTASDGINTATYTPKATDNGVTYTPAVNWVVGANGGSVDITVTCPAAPTNPCYMNAWIDWNKDGDFNDTSEQIFTNYQFNSSTGTFTLTFTIPAGTVLDGTFYSRFRIYDQLPTNPLPNGQAYNGAILLKGEIEDPFFTLKGGVVTPVTLSYFLAERADSRVKFVWSTATETGNVGFNLYVEQNGKLVQVNHELIPSQAIDSLDRLDYTFAAHAAGNTFYIEDVDIFGATRRHGPFGLGEAYGAQVEADKIDWSAIRAENQSVQALQPGLSAAAANLTSFNLKVSQSGLYRLTYEMLRDAGLDLNGVQAARLQLTNRGQVVPIYVSPGAKFGPGAYIEFLGQALDTLYTDTNIYTLQVSRTTSRRIPQVNAPPARGTTPLGTYAETLKVENQRAYANYSPSADPWYDTSMLAYKTSKSWDFPFQVDGLVNSTSATLELVVWGVTDWPQNPDHHLVVSLNGVPVGDQTFNGLTEQKLTISLPAGVLQEGANTLRLTLPGDTGVDWDVINLDKFNVTYTRLFKAADGRLTFTAAGSAFKVTNLPSGNVIIYRFNTRGAARLGGVQILASGATFTAAFAGTLQPSTYLVTTVETMYAPALEAPRPLADLNRPAQYLIIAHPNFIGGLGPLVQARQAQGLTVSVVDVNDLYAQYTYGIFDPRAIQQYIAYAAQNLGTQYVLLVGGDTYDYRNYRGLNSVSFIPSLYVMTGPTVKLVPSDPLYADVNTDNIPDLAIGRFPVRTNAELDLIVNKTLAYAAKDYGATSLFAADRNDGSISFKNISADMAADLPSDWVNENIYLEDMGVSAAKSQLLAAMNRGTALVTFTGHSGPTTWTFSGLFNTTNAAALTNAGRPFVVVQWGCWNTYYVDPSNNYLVHKFLFSGDRGAAAVLGASTLTDSNSESLLGQLLTPRMLTPGMSIGWALRDAKLELAQTHPELLDVLLGWSLMGDPALVIQP